MLAMITIVRFPPPDTVYLIGTNARRILAGIEGVSDVHVVSEEIDRATLNYEWSDPGTHAMGIDATLALQGMRRVR